MSRMGRAAVLSALLAVGAVGVATAQDAPPAEAPADEMATRIKTWLQELGSEDYDTREDATLALIKAGRRVIPQVKRLHEETKDPEVKERTRFVLDKLGALAQPKPKTEERPDPRRPQRLRPGVPGQPGVPNLDELLKGLNMPKGFQRMFEDMQKEMQKALEDMQKDLQNPQRGVQPGKPRVKVWTNVPRARKSSGFRHPTGLRARPPSAALRSHVGVTLRDGGLVLSAIKPGSWAERAGFKVHDVVLTVGGEKLISLDDLNRATEGEVKATIVRAGKRMELTLPQRELAPAEKKSQPKDF